MFQDIDKKPQQEKQTNPQKIKLSHKTFYNNV